MGNARIWETHMNPNVVLCITVKYSMLLTKSMSYFINHCTLQIAACSSRAVYQFSIIQVLGN